MKDEVIKEQYLPERIINIDTEAFRSKSKMNPVLTQSDIDCMKVYLKELNNWFVEKSDQRSDSRIMNEIKRVNRFIKEWECGI